MFGVHFVLVMYHFSGFFRALVEFYLLFLAIRD